MSDLLLFQKTPFVPTYIRGELGGTLLTEGGLPIEIETPITRLERHYLRDNKNNLRRYTVEIPEETDPEDILGIFFHFHGGYGSGDGDVDGDGVDNGSGGYRRVLDFDGTYLQDYIHVYPTAAYNGVVGGLCWTLLPFTNANSPNDVDFSRDMVDACCARYNINPATQVIVVDGVSAGAMMAIYYASEAYRQNFTYKPTHCISINGVIAFDYAGTEPFSFTGNFTSITSQLDTIVPEAGGGFGSYMSLATMQTVIGTIPSSTEYMSLTYGQHSIKSMRYGLASNTPPYTLQAKIAEILA
jgi:hypothetical protein